MQLSYKRSESLGACIMVACNSILATVLLRMKKEISCCFVDKISTIPNCC